MTLAHVVPGQEGLLAGLIHPVGGLDHLLAMLTVGLVSARHGRLWIAILPALFVLGMTAGGILGYRGVGLPYPGSGVAASVLVLGLAALADRRLPAWLVVAPVALFGVYHGYAHGAELPAQASAARFTIGFLVATVGLHVMGVLIGAIANEVRHGRRVVAGLGAGVAAAGLVFLL